MKTLVFGEILWDIIDGVPHLGGAPLNFAAHSQRFGSRAAIISCLGNDALGQKALNLVHQLDIDISYIQQTEHPTGTVPVKIINGQPSYDITKEVAFDYIDKQLLPSFAPSEFDLFYFGSLIQRNKTSREALHHVLETNTFRHIFYDVNLRKDAYTMDIILYALNQCTILKVNDEEVEVLSEMLFDSNLTVKKFCEHISAQNPSIAVIVVTMGKSGSAIYTNSKLHQVATTPIKVVDTVGAGDAFSAAFASIYLQTSDPIKAATIANKIGGYVASCDGPIPVYSEEIRQLIQSGI